jgi:hypothetical protein
MMNLFQAAISDILGTGGISVLWITTGGDAPSETGQQEVKGAWLQTSKCPPVVDKGNCSS